MSYFSTKGRIGRGRYFGYMILTIIVALGVFYVVTPVLGLTVGLTSAGPDDAVDRAQGFGLVYGWSLSLGVMLVGALQIVKRLHDLDRPGSHYFLMWIPIYNLYLALVLLFQSGTRGANRYGDVLGK
jgi:uncharacterized membrane protein YhaH (DUF805 family)